MRKEILFSPGPTNVPADILLEGAKRTIHHRTGEFAGILKTLTAPLKKVFGTDGDVFILTSSGTGAMEAAVANFVSRDDEVLVLNIGAFGKRWVNILKIHGLNPEVIEYPWGKTFNLNEVREKIKNKTYKAVFCQLSETSTGTVNDIKSLGEILPEETLLIVDAVSGLLSDEFQMDNWKVDVCASGSQKGFMMPPGLAFIAVKKDLEYLKNPSSFYFSLDSAKKSLNKGQTPWTPAVNLLYQLVKSLKMIEEEGTDNIMKRHKQLAKITRFAVKEMGLELFSSSPSNGVTAVKVPDGIDGTLMLENISNKYGVRFANGQGEYKGKIFRVAHMGYVNVPDVLMALSCLWLGLNEAGAKIDSSAIAKTLDSIKNAAI
ncbi:MAG: aminotransferase [Elusimicrobia bacterium CG08_land_8_20_14_0_20_44_26]|nr:MAG: aminotransferase [Elusimicrobia bacterium CG08_land_8_20_14_0_20_44_26]